MEVVLRELSQIVDYVIVDTPAVLEAGEALTLAALADGCVFVIGAGQCEGGDALWMKHLLENVQASIVGVVLNRSSRDAMTVSMSRSELQAEMRVPVDV